MATVTCSLTQLLALTKCFNCFSELENQAAIVYLLNQRLAKLQGVTPQTPNQLRASAACLSCTRPEAVADAFDSSVALQGAIAAGVAGASTLTPAQIKNAAKAFRNMSMSDLRAIQILLGCQLNAFP